MRKVAKGKVIVGPSNHALATKFMRMGMYKQPNKIPKKAKVAFRKFVVTGVAVGAVS